MNPQEKESNWKCNRLSRDEVTSDYASQRFDCLRRVSLRRYGRLQVNVTLKTILLSCDWLEFQSFYIDWVRLASCSASHDDQRTDYLIYYLLLFYHIIIFLLLHYYCVWPEIWPSRYFWVSVFIAVYVSLTLSLFSLGSFAKNNSKLEHLFLIISINFINRERAKQLIQDKSFRK